MNKKRLESETGWPLGADPCYFCHWLQWAKTEGILLVSDHCKWFCLILWSRGRYQIRGPNPCCLQALVLDWSVRVSYSRTSMSSCLYGPWVADTLGCHIPVIRCCRAVCSHISAELTRGAISGGTHFQTHCLSNSAKSFQTSVILMRWRSDLLFIINPFSKERSISLEQASKTQIELKNQPYWYITHIACFAKRHTYSTTAVVVAGCLLSMLLLV